MSLSSVPRPVKTYHTDPYDRLSQAKSAFDGAGKTVLIAGGATGIGYVIATSYAESGLSRLIIVSRSAEPQAKAKAELLTKFPNLKVETHLGSVTDWARMEEIIQTVGPIDVLVLGAARAHPLAKSLDVAVSDYAATILTNVIGGWNLVRAYLRQPPPPSGKRTVINLSSASAHSYGLPCQTAYGPSKLASSHMLAFLALEHSPDKDGVVLQSFHPGAILTDLAKAWGYDESSLAWEDVKVPGDYAVWLATKDAEFLHGRFTWTQWDVDEVIGLKERCENEPSFLKPGINM